MEKQPPIEPFAPRSTQQPWGTETLIAATEHYTGKILYYKAGLAGGLQYHVEKDETFYLVSGSAEVWFEVEGRKLEHLLMAPTDSIHVPPLAVHRFEAITDCVVFEVSTPHYDDRVNVSARFGYSRSDDLPSTWRVLPDGSHERMAGNWPSRVVLDKASPENSNS